MDAGAGLVERNGDLELALAREYTGQVRRTAVWAVHELRDMGCISRDLIETAERFAALHLRLEPTTKGALWSGEGRGGAANPHAHLLRRAALAEHVNGLYEAVYAKLKDGRQTAVFSAAFSPMRPSIGELRASFGADFATVRNAIETGLMRLYMREPICPPDQELTNKALAVNELARI